MLDNQAMLARIQSKQSTYDALAWEHERKHQVKLVEKLCMFKPSITKGKRSKRRIEKLDLVKKAINSSQNKDMYNSIKLNLQLQDENPGFRNSHQ